MKLLILVSLFASFAAAQTCKLPDFPVTGTVDGTLQRNDCLISNYLPDYPNLQIPTHAWKLVVKKTAVYRIRVASTTMDPFLIIADSTGTIVDLDDDGGGGTDSELLMQLIPGEYTVLATVAVGGLGSYKLTGETSAVRQCKPKALESADTDGELSADDCRFADVIPLLSSHSLLDTYTIETKQPGIVTLRMDSTALDSYVGILSGEGKILADDDNGGGGKNSRLRLSIPAGTTVLFATSAVPGTGAYRVRTEVEDRRKCEIGTINPGATRNGMLSADGCRTMDAFDGSRDESRMSRFTFELRQMVVVKLGVTSPDFDTYLSLIDSKGKIITENDNADRSTSNSAITAALAPGTYTVAIRGMRNGTGSFELSLATEYTKTCDVTALAMPGATTGTLNTAQCRYLDLMQPSTSAFAAQSYKFTVDKKSFVTLTATGTGYAPNIHLLTPTGEWVSSQLLINNKIEQLLLPGEYRLMVWHRTGTGNYTIAAETREPAPCPATEILLGTPVTGTLNGLDCMQRELYPGPSGQLPADAYSLQLTEADTITVTAIATHDEFLPIVDVLDADGKVVMSGIDTFKFEGKPGTYTIVVSTVFRGGGDYSLSVTGRPAPPVQ